MAADALEYGDGGRDARLPVLEESVDDREAGVKAEVAVDRQRLVQA